MNPTARISFYLPRGGRASLHRFDVRGRLVRTLVDRSLDKGVHAFMWDGRNTSGSSVASGVYYYRLTFGEERLTKKLIVVK